MTVGELVNRLAAEDPDAAMQIVDGDKIIEFKSTCIIRDTKHRLVAIDLTHKDCEVVDEFVQ